MKFEEGNPGGPGRPKGLRNKRTQEILEQIDKIMSILDETMEEDIKKLRPSERTKLKTDLLEYQIPKLARTETKIEGDVEFRHVDYKEKTDD